MAISIVNGYVCTSCCDVAKAKRGEDPHPLTVADRADSRTGDEMSDASRTDGPAVLFGGSLNELLAGRSVTGTEATQTADQAGTRQLVVDRLA